MSSRPLVNVSAPPASQCETLWPRGVSVGLLLVSVTVGRGDESGRSRARPASEIRSVRPSALQAALALKVVWRLAGGHGGNRDPNGSDLRWRLSTW